MEKNKRGSIYVGIGLMIVSSLFTAFGQLFWKEFNRTGEILYIILGFLLYGLGAMVMILSLKFGELSVLYPVMCTSYIFALVNGYVFLGEVIDIKKLIGIGLIILGVVFIGRGEKKKCQ